VLYCLHQLLQHSQRRQAVFPVLQLPLQSLRQPLVHQQPHSIHFRHTAEARNRLRGVDAREKRREDNNRGHVPLDVIQQLQGTADWQAGVEDHPLLSACHP